ncbi:TetR family transcriptional regulator [Sphingomonas cavernae]|nr:TetR family transcriptional regulator [Sphingomonas cavernae]
MKNAYKKPAKALIEAAERLIATQGLGVPLREIGQAAGSANKVAVQYHFGDRQRLIEAVFEYRLPQLETRRAILLAETEARGCVQEPAALLEALLRPISEVLDASGRRRFAGFLYQLTANARSARAAFDEIAPAAQNIVERLRQSLPGMTPATFNRRLGSASLVFLDTLVRFEDEEAPGGAGTEEALALARAVLTGPVIE